MIDFIRIPEFLYWILIVVCILGMLAVTIASERRARRLEAALLAIVDPPIHGKQTIVAKHFHAPRY